MQHDQDAHFTTLMSMLTDNHIRGIKFMRTLDMSADELRRAVCAAACCYYRMLRNDPVRRDEFYKEAFPEGWLRFHPNKLLLHVFMYLKRAKKKGANYNVASSHSVALQPVCDDRSVADEDIAAYIKQHGGLSGLMNIGENVGGAQTDEDAPKEGLVYDDDDDGDDDDGDDDDYTGDEDDEEVRRPMRKRETPGAADLKLLPRGYISRCVLAQPENEVVKDVIVRAVEGGKEVIVTLSKGQTSETHELHADGGCFIGIKIKDYEVI